MLEGCRKGAEPLALGANQLWPVETDQRRCPLEDVRYHVQIKTKCAGVLRDRLSGTQGYLAGYRRGGAVLYLVMRYGTDAGGTGSQQRENWNMGPFQ